MIYLEEMTLFVLLAFTLAVGTCKKSVGTMVTCFGTEVCNVSGE